MDRVQHLRNELAATPAALAWLCRGITDAQANSSLDEFGWTFVQLLIHLWDYELEIGSRFERLLQEDMPQFQNWNEQESMKTWSDAKLSISKLLNEFRIRREKTLEFYDRAGERGLEKELVMPRGEVITGLEYAHRVARHDRNHMGTMVKILAKGE